MKLLGEECSVAKSSRRSRAHFVSYYSSNNISVQGFVLIFWIFIEKKPSISLLPDLCWFCVFEMLIALFFHQFWAIFQTIIVSIEEEFTFNFSSNFQIQKKQIPNDLHSIVFYALQNINAGLLRYIACQDSMEEIMQISS